LKDLYDFLTDRLRGVKKLAVLGAGSILRADDAAGVMAVENLMADCSIDKYPNVRFYLGETAPENYSGNIRIFCPTHLLIIDAADLGQKPGDIVDINPETVGGPTFCSHMLPLKIMIDYLISETGAAVTLLGIQYKNIAFDTAMTPEIKEAVEEVCETLKKVIDELL
jgi:hydrogenase 3 maturation protease